MSIARSARNRPCAASRTTDAAGSRIRRPLATSVAAAMAAGAALVAVGAPTASAEPLPIAITQKCDYLFAGSMMAGWWSLPSGYHAALCQQTFTSSGTLSMADLGAVPGSLLTVQATGGSGASYNGNFGGKPGTVSRELKAPAAGGLRLAIGDGGHAPDGSRGGAGGAGGGANGGGAGGGGGDASSNGMGGGGGGGATGVYLSTTDGAPAQTADNLVAMAPGGGGASPEQRGSGAGVEGGASSKVTNGPCPGGTATSGGNGQPAATYSDSGVDRPCAGGAAAGAAASGGSGGSGVTMYCAVPISGGGGGGGGLAGGAGGGVATEKTCPKSFVAGGGGAGWTTNKTWESDQSPSSVVVKWVVDLAPATTITASTTSLLSGDEVTLTAATHPKNQAGRSAWGARGDISFFIDGQRFRTLQAYDGTDAKLILTDADLTAGTHTIRAEYSGNYGSARSADITITKRAASKSIGAVKTPDQLVEVNGASMDNGAVVDTWQQAMSDGNVQGNQLWRLVPNPANPGWSQVVGKQTGKCLERNGTDGKIDQWDCVPGAANELWRLTDNGTAGGKALQLKSTGDYLATVSGKSPGPLQNGTQLVLTATPGGLATGWIVTSYADAG